MGLLRLFLAYVVLLSHTPEGIIIHKLLHPALAVQCFYAISGFYIQLLVKEYSKTKQKLWFFDFYKSRVIRLFPTYFICLLITIILSPRIIDIFSNLDNSHKIIYFINNAFIFTQSIFRFSKNSYTIMGQSWTLSLEIMFYMLAPYLLTKNNRIILLIIILSICIRLTLRDYGLYLQSWFYSFFPSEIAIFLAGSMSYRFYETFLLNKNNFINYLLKIIGFFALACLIYFYLEGWNHISGGVWDGQATCGVPKKYWCALFLTVLSLPWIFKWSKALKFDRYLGELSYPLYMSHFIFIALLQDKMNKQYVNLTVLILSIAFSIILVKYVEMPLANFRLSLRERKNQENNIHDIETLPLTNSA